MTLQQKNRIYLDYAATTPMDPLVLKAMEPYFIEKFGNPNSPHAYGQESLIAVDYAREMLATFLNCSSKEIVFTSGATESNNLAIRGVVKKYQKIVKKPEIISTGIEHPSVLNTCHDLADQGIGLKYFSSSKDGVMNIADLQKLITDSTVLVSVMYANNEIGTIQPIRAIGKLLRRINKDRKIPILFHTDAVQAAGTLNCDVRHLHVDLLSLSAHKIYGPKGIGALYVKNGIPISKIQSGGDQEYNLRAGTIPVPNIVGFGKAVDLLITHQEKDKKKMTSLRNWAHREIVKSIPDVKISGKLDSSRLANNLHLRVDKINGGDIMFLLDSQANIAVSTGSACSTGAPEPSKVLTEIGLSQKKSQEGLRVTLGRMTTKHEMSKFVSSYVSAVNTLKK